MDRINKFLNARQEKHKKNIKYKDQKFTITKEDLKTIRAYKASKCLDPSIKNVPSRKIDANAEPLEPLKPKIKKDRSDYYNKKLKEYYEKNPRPKVIKVSKNEIVDVWDDECLEDLKYYQQEWTYSINTPYDDKVENLKFSKENLEEELQRIHLKHFRPRDLKMKPIRELLPSIPKVENLKPYPEFACKEWAINGRCVFFGNICCIISQNMFSVKDLTYNKTIIEHQFEEEILKVSYCDQNIAVASKNTVYLKDLQNSDAFRLAISMTKPIKDIYLDKTFLGVLTPKSIHLFDPNTFEEIKILKLKGDVPRTLKIIKDCIYVGTHKGIIVESEQKTEVKNLGYVVDFEVAESGAIFAINNLGRLLTVDSSFNVIGNTVQSGIGSQLKYHKRYDLLAILFHNEIGFYKVIEDSCIPINSISGSFKSIDWDPELPWLYASQKNGVYMFS